MKNVLFQKRFVGANDYKKGWDKALRNFNQFLEMEFLLKNTSPNTRQEQFIKGKLGNYKS